MMEDKRQILKPSGIPRTLSKLPLPRSSTSTSLRPSPSRDQLNGGEIRNPKLRTAPSRDRLATARPTLPTNGTTRKKELPQASRLQTNFQNPPVSYSPRSAESVETGETRFMKQSGEAAATSPSTARNDVLFKRSLTLTRRPSEVFNNSPTQPATPAKSSPAKVEVEDPVLGASRSHTNKPRPSLSERTIETLSQIPSSPALRGKTSAFFDPNGASRRSPPRPGSRASHSSRSGSRPGSSYQSDGSNRPTSRGGPSRPGSSSRQEESLPSLRSSSNAFAPLTPISGTPSQVRPLNMKTLRKMPSLPSTSTKPGDIVRASARKLPTPQASRMPPPRSRTPSPEKREATAENQRPVAKTLAARPLKPRASLNGLFKRPSAPAFDKPTVSPASRKTSLVSHQSSTTSSDDTAQSSSSPTSTVLTVDSSESGSAMATRKSSAALREQIAKAKAAKRAAAQQTKPESNPPAGSATLKPPVVPTDDSFDFGLCDNPFGQRRSELGRNKIIQERVATARTSGRLNIAALGLRDIPAEVLKMYDPSSIGGSGGAWAECVDLTRFVAADNELEMIDESIFPDRDPQEFSDDEDSPISIFGALETLDLHGNMLISLPMGLRRLQHLTSLNLSSNRITNPSYELIAEITSLRDLKLGGNLFYGPLNDSFSKLVNLEILDLHGNNISALPAGITSLSKLRILNLSENSFESLPFELLSKLPLTELLARKNKLSGVLIDDSVQSLEHMQTMDLSSNQLTHLVSPTDGNSIAMPSLHQLCLSMNRLQTLPDLSLCVNLLTLTADENSISAVPDGMSTLEKLRHVDFSSNDIRVIPPEISRMDNLAMLRLSGNPLRDKKFCSITTDELKDILATRLEPAPFPNPEPQDEGGKKDGEALLPSPVEDWHRSSTAGAKRQNGTHRSTEDQDDSRSDNDDFATPPTSAPQSPARSRSHTMSNQTWSIKNGGVLDRSHTHSSSLHPVICSRVSSEHRVREVQLHHNLFSTLPESLSFFAETLTSLSLAHNQLVGESYLVGVRLELPALRELNLSSNHITSLLPLTANLVSPCLQKLDVSVNRISALPPGTALRDSFPELTVLLASNNHLVELEPESIRGMRVVDAGNNDIAHLNPRLGLLGGSSSGGGGSGLERLEVMGNRFRVPRFNVLERGTEATLRWLRGRVPVAEMAAWREGAGSGGAGAVEELGDDFD